eukprot:CAMPEP_0176492920 /NCGR_PEP_ID=MMETSP0200_2-20121128/9277_1 /TAXON_ID=947934 /ORGANISM="Chaetoceros sp., Strain GSL56" /LENGTH=1074 /DNA_ID=CAMNT_0017890557 /DNA_START=216 /DNA_END=3440 /DNA_ORIENTATION=-
MNPNSSGGGGKTAPPATSTASAGPRLGPSWRSTTQGGRGFQPPSASTTTQETSSGKPTSDSNRNSFSILDTDDDARSFSATTTTKLNEASTSSSSSPKRNFSSRSEGLRSAGIGGGAFGNRSSSSGTASSSKGGGRSLADLASRLPSSSGTAVGRTGSVNRRSGSGDDTYGMTTVGRIVSLSSSSGREYVEDKHVVRYTREKLLSMRPRTDPSATRPERLKVLDGTPLLSTEPLDPVCWDIFDAEEIWNQSRERRTTKSQSSGIPVRRDLDQHERRGSSRVVEEDRWQRGVALPPPGEGSRRDSSNERYDSNNPDDLWDDPLSPTEAAADFSAFGGSLEDEPMKSSGNVFDLAMMAEATKKFDEEVKGTSGSVGEGLMESRDHAVNPKRPLASVGTTIRSGSGNDVNVFEDFDVPDAVSTDDDAIRPGTVDQTASSRLMQMIGVSTSEDRGVVESDVVIQPQPEATDSNVFGVFGAPSIVPSNPWGLPMPSATGAGGGFDLSLKLREVTQPESQNVELEMRRKQLEEEKRRAALLAQQQAEQQVKQSVVQNQQPQVRHQQPEYSQVELVLAERISTILENCWGRADLMTILQTLHNDDSRVIPLLGSVDALRALIVRHPLRFALTKDPTFGSEMAALVMNNLQWQQHRAAEELQRRQQEEHQKMLAVKEAEARAKAEAPARVSEPVIIMDAPWFYADPQGNIQGPFKAIEMRQWLEAGYFKGDLPISQNRNGGFRALSSLFPDLSVAFKPTGPSKEERARIAEIEAARAASEARARAEVEAREAADRMARANAAREAEAAKVKESANTTNQSAKLKMLLGLGHGNSNEVVGINNAQDSERVETTTQNKASKSKAKKVAANKVDATPSAPATVQTPAWGGAGAPNTQAKGKSMSEIQKEEAAQLSKQKKSSAQTGGGWAGVAASGGTTAWSGATVKAPNVPTSLGNPMSNAQQGRSKQQMSSSSSYSNANDSRLSTQMTLEEFGANDKMTPELESWCKQQMKKLNGSDDLTLVAFCMTLNDSVEIKQYLTAYLGSTPQVNNFASEFINRKHGNKQQDQWETTTSNKKGRKKKASK